MKLDWLHPEDTTTASTRALTSDAYSRLALGVATSLPEFNPKCELPTVRIELDASVHRPDFTPKRILRSGPATIVFWSDGTKTVVKRSPDEPDNAYAAFTAALGIKLFGSNSKLKRVIDRHTEEQK